MMRSYIFWITVFAFVSLTTSQGQSDAVTDQNAETEVLSFVNDFEKIVIARLKTGTDMLDGLNKIVHENSIKNGVIISGIGSVTSYHVHVVSSLDLPPDQVFMKEDRPYDLIAVNGYVFNGRVHAHITLSDEKRAIGGHLEPGTHALTFIIMTIGVLKEDADLSKVDSYTISQGPVPGH